MEIMRSAFLLSVIAARKHRGQHSTTGLLNYSSQSFRGCEITVMTPGRRNDTTSMVARFCAVILVRAVFGDRDDYTRIIRGCIR